MFVQHMDEEVNINVMPPISKPQSVQHEQTRS